MPTLYIDTDASDISKSAVRALNIRTPAGIPQLVLGDNRDWIIYFITGAGAYTSWSGSASYSLRVGIGPSGTNPTGGTFTIGGDGAVVSGTTAPIPFDAQPDAVLSAITHPSSGLTIVSSGQPVTDADISVSGDVGDFVLNFAGDLANTAIGSFVCSHDELTPTSGSVVSVIRAGGSGFNARQSLRLRQLPYCFQDTFTRITNGWQGKLSTNTETLAGWLGNNESGELPFEIEITDGSGSKTTYFQGTASILNEVIDNQALVPTPLPSEDYYTIAETDALLAYKANLASPELTGTPTAPTAAGGTNTTQIATTAFVQLSVSGITFPVTSVNGKTGTVVLSKSDIGLGNVDNTSDANKPISTTTQTALNAKLTAASNLSDLASVSTARTNLGLGTAATRDVGQSSGNVLELSAAGVVSLGGTGVNGAIRLYDSINEAYSQIDVQDGDLRLSNYTLRTSSGQVIVFTDSGLTATRTFNLPDASGTLALTSDLTNLQSKAEVKSANFTAANDGVYTITASATLTDPSPTEGKGFVVFVRNGTATVGGTGYATAGTVIRRIFHSGAWANYTYSSGSGGSGSLTVGTSTITGGTSGRVLYNNAGVLGELALGSNVATALAVNVGSSGSFAVTGGATSPTAISSAGNTALTVAATETLDTFLITASAGAGGYTATVSLNTSTPTPQAGAQAIVKIDLAASNNPRIQLRSNTTVIGEAVGNGTARRVTFRCVFDGAAWAIVSRVPQAEVFTVTRTQAPAGATGSTGSWTWSLPAGAQTIEAWLVASGGGGGSGRRGAAGSARSGGGGGAGGNVSVYTLSAISLPSQSLVFTLAAGGAGGAAVTTDDTNGNAGSAGGAATLTSGSLTILAIPAGGGGGAAGTTTTVSGGTAGGNVLRLYQGASGGGSSATAAASSAGNVAAPAPGGGGGGGGISTGNAAFAGGAGSFTVTSANGGALGGAATGAAGMNAVAQTNCDQTVVGCGAGGGGGNSAGTGGTGGAGYFGCGGGGGGASVNGFASGAGGNGGDAVSRLTVFF